MPQPETAGGLMLTTLIAIRAIAPGDVGPGEPGDVVTPAERLIRIPRTGSARPAITAREPIDPSDRLDFVVDMSALLEPGEKFAVISFTVMPEAVALGFRIIAQGPHAPVALDDSKLRLWATVDPAYRTLAAWNGGGAACLVEFTGSTDSIPARDWQRTIAMRVAHR